MITGKERHERAKNFRDMISAREYGIPGKVGSFVDIDDLISELLDRRVYDSEVAIDACEALVIADLIDRPTCTIVNSWQEITPGLGELDLSDMCGFELSCGHEVNGYEKPHYCSECGAVVVDED